MSSACHVKYPSSRSVLFPVPTGRAAELCRLIEQHHHTRSRHHVAATARVGLRFELQVTVDGAADIDRLARACRAHRRRAARRSDSTGSTFVRHPYRVDVFGPERAGTRDRPLPLSRRRPKVRRRRAAIARADQSRRAETRRAIRAVSSGSIAGGIERRSRRRRRPEASRAPAATAAPRSTSRSGSTAAEVAEQGQRRPREVDFAQIELRANDVRLRRRRRDEHVAARIDDARRSASCPCRLRIR